MMNHVPMNYGEKSMKDQLPNARQWHPIESAILEHLRRYELITPTDAVLGGILGMDTEEVAANRLVALEKRHIVQRATLNTPSPCYIFTQREFALREEADSKRDEKVQPLSVQSMLRRYAMLKFCLQRAPPRRKLTPEEFQSRFPDMYRAAHSHHYYTTFVDSQPRIGFLRVDLGGRGRWDRIVAKARSDINRHLQFPIVQQLLAKQAFEVAVVTATLEKARRIHDALQAKHAELPVPSYCEAIPELGDVIRPSPHQF